MLKSVGRRRLVDFIKYNNDHAFQRSIGSCSNYADIENGDEYNRIPKWYEIPMQRKDFQGYRRKAMKISNDLIILHDEAMYEFF